MMRRINSGIWRQKEKVERQAMTAAEYRRLYANPVSSEEELQEEIVKIWRLHTPCDQWFRLFHPANGGYRQTLEAAKFKRMGVVAGIADLVCLLQDKKVGFIELKFGKNDATPAQEAFANFCKKERFPYALCRTVNEALKTLENWGIYDPKKSGLRTPQVNEGVDYGKEE